MRVVKTQNAATKHIALKCSLMSAPTPVLLEGH